MDYTSCVKVNAHSSIRIEAEAAVLYFDPFMIKEETHDADYIFITHEHYDHFSPEDIAKIRKENTFFVMPESMGEKLAELPGVGENYKLVAPNESYVIGGYKVETVGAYNIPEKQFHTKERLWVGYLIDPGNGAWYYITGDTQANEDNMKLEGKVNVLIIPVGGTYTFDPKEGAEFTRHIKPDFVIPTHYGSIVGEYKDFEAFRDLIGGEIPVAEKIVL